MTVGTGCRAARPGGELRLLDVDPPAAGAGARDALKAYLRVESGDEDATLDRLIAVAIGHGEAFTGRLWLVRDVAETLALDGAWRRLGATPVRAIAGADALDLGGAATPLAAATYAFDIDAAGDGWVRLGGGAAMPRVRLRYQAGLAAAWAGVPDPLQQGALRLAAHLFAHRDAADEGEPPAAVAALWRPWRRMRLS